MTSETGTLLTTSETADRLGIRSELLAQWRYQRTGPPFHRLGRLVRYDLNEIDAWLEDQRVAPGV
jgi:predicted DNA-binding transcriptional regulator AlpA